MHFWYLCKTLQGSTALVILHECEVRTWRMRSGWRQCSTQSRKTHNYRYLFNFEEIPPDNIVDMALKRKSSENVSVLLDYVFSRYKQADLYQIRTIRCLYQNSIWKQVLLSASITVWKVRIWDMMYVRKKYYWVESHSCEIFIFIVKTESVHC